jgi:peptidoglycan-associated lipoprotein
MTVFERTLWAWPTTNGCRACHRLDVVLLLSAVFSLIILMGGCSAKTPVAQTPTMPPPPPPTAPTATIEATPATVQAGQSMTLTWHTENATDVAIEQFGPVQTNGSQTLTPTESVTYHLTAKGPGGVQEADARVTVVAAPAASVASTGEEAPPVEATNRLDVFFDLDDYSIRPDQVSTIQSDAAFLKEHPDLRIVVEGHCDELGSTEYNLALGDKRAAQVKYALEKAGITSDRMRIISYGKEQPICQEQNESCWKLNRRAHIAPDLQR